MTLDHAITQFTATNNLASQQVEFLQRILNAPKPERRHHYTHMTDTQFGCRVPGRHFGEPGVCCSGQTGKSCAHSCQRLVPLELLLRLRVLLFPTLQKGVV